MKQIQESIINLWKKAWAKKNQRQQENGEIILEKKIYANIYVKLNQISLLLKLWHHQNNKFKMTDKPITVEGKIYEKRKITLDFFLSLSLYFVVSFSKVQFMYFLMSPKSYWNLWKSYFLELILSEKLSAKFVNPPLYPKWT